MGALAKGVSGVDLAEVCFEGMGAPANRVLGAGTG